MTLPANRLSHPAVRALVTALNHHDEQAFYDALTPDATMPGLTSTATVTHDRGAS